MPTKAELQKEIKRLKERIFTLELSMEEYRLERPTEYCMECYAYIEDYEGDGVKDCLCPECENN